MGCVIGIQPFSIRRRHKGRQAGRKTDAHADASVGGTRAGVAVSDVRRFMDQRFLVKRGGFMEKRSAQLDFPGRRAGNTLASPGAAAEARVGLSIAAGGSQVAYT